ncbi:hypothetical protein evm_005657 [Chilo suppressalis]|nr:hypothetical protein evm_005657 [Chilo suppressalis]
MENNLESLQNEVDFYRQNQAIVEQDIHKLIEDNQRLSQQVEHLMREKQHTERAQLNNNADKEIEELRKQILLITKERDSLHVLWQTSQKTIDALETELKAYQSYTGKQDTNEGVREVQLKFDTALQDYLELETKYKDLSAKLSSLETELKYKDKEIVTYKERGKEIEDKLKEITAELDEYKMNLAAEKNNNEEIRAQLLSCQKECVDEIKRELEAKSKVAEALQLFDLVSTQKHEAHKKISELSGELQEIKHRLANTRKDIETKCRIELEEVRSKYNEKVTDMLVHIKNLDAELVEKGMLLNKALRENKILLTTNEENLKKQTENLQAVPPKLALAEQRIEAMFQELVTSERRNIQLLCEKQCLAIDIQRIQDVHLREIKRRNWEEDLLKIQCEELKLQVEHLQKSLDETHNMISKLQIMLASRTELSQKMVNTKEQELVEINKHLENQMVLNKKWKESYVEMTEKLKKRLLDLQAENKDLKIKLKLPDFGSTETEDKSTS